MAKKCKHKFKEGDFVKSPRRETWKVIHTTCDRDNKPKLTVSRYWKGIKVATIGGVGEKRLKKVKQ